MDRARTVVEQAMARSEVMIKELHETDELTDARVVFDQVWPSSDGGTQVRSNLLRALIHAGGYCSAAYDIATGALLGATLGFMGRSEDGQPFLHSHMSGVIEGHRDRHIGTAMKLHQRWWALREGVPVIAWTFDPLVRRNAYINLCKLGVEVRGYHVNFYGEMRDAINAGDPTDRVVAWWEVDSERAESAAAGLRRPLPDAQLQALPDVRLVDTPHDIVELRLEDPDRARAWRLQVREELSESLAQGWFIDAITEQGSYVLRPRLSL
jgi:predicted GNAT superfamily acetyltransferase